MTAVVYRGRLVKFVGATHLLATWSSEEELLSVVRELEQKNGRVPDVITVGYA